MRYTTTPAQSVYGYPCICGGFVSEWIEVDENLDPVDFSTAFCSDECYREAMAERDAEVWGERP